MTSSKKEIDTPRIKKTYFKCQERIRKAHLNSSKIFSHIYYSNKAVLEEVRQAKESLRSLKDTFTFNEFNDGVLKEKAQRLMDLERALLKNDEEARKSIDAINEIIISLRKLISERDRQIDDQFLLNREDV